MLQNIDEQHIPALIYYILPVLTSTTNSKHSPGDYNESSVLLISCHVLIYSNYKVESTYHEKEFKWHQSQQQLRWATHWDENELMLKMSCWQFYTQYLDESNRSVR
jgi:hypothetical protein